MKGIITFELCAEDRERVDRLIQALEGSQPAKVEKPETSLTQLVLQAMGEPTATEKPAEPEKPKATLADIQAKVQKLASPSSGKRDQVKELIKGYAERVSQIPEDKFDEVMRGLTAIEEG